jgi:hypothetical protein
MAQFYFRVAHNEAKLVSTCASNAFDAAIVPASYLTASPKGDGDRDPWGLAAALSRRGVPWVVDLTTPRLTDPNVVQAASCERLRAASFVANLPLPLSPVDLANGERRNDFVDAAVRFQNAVPMLTAPYLEMDGEELVGVNVAMLRRVVGAAGDRLAVGFVQVTLRALCAGVAAQIARRYAEARVTRVFLRVRGLRLEAAGAAQISKYLEALDAFRDANIEVVSDPAGRFGGAVCAAGAVGFSAGSQFFRSVPRRVIALSGGGGGAKIAVELPRYLTAPRDLLPREVDCPVNGCAAARGDYSNAALKEHNLHYLRHVGNASTDVDVVAADLRASAQPAALAWAEALDQRKRRIA